MHALPLFIPQFETARVVWSWHSQDPTGLDNIRFHEFMGSTSLNLLSGRIEREDPPDAEAYTVNVGNVCMSLLCIKIVRNSIIFCLLSFKYELTV